MSAEIIPLRRDRYEGLSCGRCGCVWFQLVDLPSGRPGAVVVDEQRQITGYFGDLICRECGDPFQPATSRPRKTR